MIPEEIEQKERLREHGHLASAFLRGASVIALAHLVNWVFQFKLNSVLDMLFITYNNCATVLSKLLLSMQHCIKYPLGMMLAGKKNRLPNQTSLVRSSRGPLHV